VIAANDNACRVLSVKQLAERWCLDQKTIREAIELGQVPAFRVGRRRLLIPLAAVEELEQGRVAASGER
jgi:excisionase family DNA binding protein